MSCRSDMGTTDTPTFPRAVHNRAGLKRIGYRIGQYPQIRHALLDGLTRDPVLGALTYRGCDDPGIALLEATAEVGDILTFYQELYANEVYLRTAQWRESVADLVRLTGYLLAPGMGCQGAFALEVKSPIVMPARFPFKAQLTATAEQVDFETAESVSAYPALSRFHLYRNWRYAPIAASTSAFSVPTALLERSAPDLKKGDRILLVAGSSVSTTQQIAVVSAMKERFEQTEISIAGAWGGSAGRTIVAAYTLGRTFRLFGHNQASSMTRVRNSIAMEEVVSFAKATGVHGAAPEYALDRAVDDLSVGSTVLVSLDLYDREMLSPLRHVLKRRIVDVATKTVTWGAMTNATSVVRFNRPVSVESAPMPRQHTDIRSVEIHEVVGRAFPVRGVRTIDTTSHSPRLYFFGTRDSWEKLHGRTVRFAHDSHVEEAVAYAENASLVKADASTVRLWPVRLSRTLAKLTTADFDLDAPTVDVFGNLVAATQGKTQPEVVLGNGDQRQEFQTFKLPRVPLTYATDVCGSGVPRELSVYVNQKKWECVSSLLKSGPLDEVYIVRQDADNASWIQFGDGATGRRLPSGAGNVTAVFRTGTNGQGSQKPKTSVLTQKKLAGLASIKLVGSASGGAAPERADKAREAAPGRVQSLDRLVSLHDYEIEALSVPGVSKASARWDAFSGIAGIALTILMENGREAEIDAVRDAFHKREMAQGARRHPVTIVEGVRRFVYCALDIAISQLLRPDAIEPLIMHALGAEADTVPQDGLFSLSSRQFGEREYLNRIEAAVQNVTGVQWVHVTALGLLDDAPDPVAFPPRPEVRKILACSSRHILALRTAHVRIQWNAGEGAQ